MVLSELRGRHLLILGVHLPDWLGRFVLRAARDRLLLAQRSYFIAREGAASARTLDEFLRRFGRETHIQVCDALSASLSTSCIAAGPSASVRRSRSSQ